MVDEGSNARPTDSWGPGAGFGRLRGSGRVCRPGRVIPSDAEDCSRSSSAGTRPGRASDAELRRSGGARRREPEPGADAGERRSAEALVVDIDVEALCAKAAKADEYLELAQRTQAEFDNYRKRTARDAAAAQERGAMKLAKELLPAIDNLDRALAHAASTEENGDGR